MNSSEYYRNWSLPQHLQSGLLLSAGTTRPAGAARITGGNRAARASRRQRGTRPARAWQALWGNGALRVFPAPAEKEVPRVSRGPGENRGCREFREFPESVGLRENAGLPGWQNTAYAQYGVTASPASGSFLPLYPVWGAGGLTSLPTDDTITLQPGYVYAVSYVFLATPEPGNYFQILPFINGTPRLLYSFTGNAANGRNAAASAFFLTNEALYEPVDLSFSLTYPDTVRNIDISGAVSIYPAAIAVSEEFF